MAIPRRTTARRFSNGVSAAFGAVVAIDDPRKPLPESPTTDWAEGAVSQSPAKRVPTLASLQGVLTGSVFECDGSSMIPNGIVNVGLTESADKGGSFVTVMRVGLKKVQVTGAIYPNLGHTADDAIRFSRLSPNGPVWARKLRHPVISLTFPPVLVRRSAVNACDGRFAYLICFSTRVVSPFSVRIE